MAYNALSELIGSSSLDHFLTTKLQKEPHFAPDRQNAKFLHLLGLRDIDRFLSTIKYRTTECFCVNGSDPIDVSEFATRGVVDSRKALRLYSAGATIILNRAHVYHHPLADLCSSLGSELSAPCQTNIYLTPPNSVGLRTHYDTHDVFIIQIAGVKKWRVHNIALELPLAGQGTDANIEIAKAPVLETELREGQVLYIPRGWTHDAVTTSSLSLHITLGVFFYTWADAILEYVSYSVLNDARFRTALPLDFLRQKFDAAPATQMLQNLLMELAKQSDFCIAKSSFTQQYAEQVQPTTAGLLEQLVLLDRLNEDSIVQSSLLTREQILQADNALTINVPGGTISIERSAWPAAMLCISGATVQIKDLLPLVSLENALALVRRLVASEALKVVSA